MTYDDLYLRKGHPFNRNLKSDKAWAKRKALVLWRMFDSKRHLDLGCAEGFLVEAMRERGIESFGVDISQAALARSTVGQWLSQGDLRDGLDFDPQSFDLLTAYTVFDYIRGVDMCMKECLRLLKPGGWLVTTSRLPLRELGKSCGLVHDDLMSRRYANYTAPLLSIMLHTAQARNQGEIRAYIFKKEKA